MSTFNWQDIIGETLYHGTCEAHLDNILLEGGIIKAPSYWGTKRMAQYYAEVMEDDLLMKWDGGKSIRPMIVEVPMSRFRKSKFKVDNPSVAEPITTVLGKDDITLEEEWAEARGTWQDCLRIFESVIYTLPLRISERDVL